jgi:hypothetical protein
MSTKAAVGTTRMSRGADEPEISNKLIKRTAAPSVCAPNAGNFYFDYQTNNNVCSLCALCNYVGDSWISLNFLNGLKSSNEGSMATFDLLAGKIVATLLNMQPHLKAAQNTNDDANNALLAIESLFKNIEIFHDSVNNNYRYVTTNASTIVSQLNLIAFLLNDAKIKGIPAGDINNLKLFAKEMNEDCVDVSSGGADPSVVLKALLQIDSETEMHDDWGQNKGGELDYEVLFKNLNTFGADRAIVCTGYHFITVRKNKSGKWYILDSLQKAPVMYTAGVGKARKKFYGSAGCPCVGVICSKMKGEALCHHFLVLLAKIREQGELIR